MDKNKILLVGYMGCGKSAVGNLLKSEIEYIFWDLDDYIEQVEKQTIASIFDKKGEIYFRKIERKCLEVLIANPKPMIIALGGGTPCYFDTMKMITELNSVTTFYLKTSINELSRRLLPFKEKRPLIRHLQTLDEIQEFIGKHLFERAPFYSQSDNIINTDGKTAQGVVDEIKAILT